MSYSSSVLEGEELGQQQHLQRAGPLRALLVREGPPKLSLEVATQGKIPTWKTFLPPCPALSCCRAGLPRVGCDPSAFLLQAP